MSTLITLPEPAGWVRFAATNAPEVVIITESLSIVSDGDDWIIKSPFVEVVYSPVYTNLLAE